MKINYNPLSIKDRNTVIKHTDDIQLFDITNYLIDDEFQYTPYIISIDENYNLIYFHFYRINSETILIIKIT